MSDDVSPAQNVYVLGPNKKGKMRAIREWRIGDLTIGYESDEARIIEITKLSLAVGAYCYSVGHR